MGVLDRLDVLLVTGFIRRPSSNGLSRASIVVLLDATPRAMMTMMMKS